MNIEKVDRNRPRVPYRNFDIVLIDGYLALRTPENAFFFWADSIREAVEVIDEYYMYER